MFWADKLLEGRTGSECVNDAWTPSGITHMGGLKGPVIHDTLYKIIKEQGREATTAFGVDDYDPIDGLPDNLKEKMGEFMGIPTCNAPAPAGEGSFADYYTNVMRDLFRDLNIEAKFYLASENYRNGTYNKAIKIVLDNVEKMRKVYADMYKKQIADDWYPLQVVCPTCGKVGTTKVTSWDGEKVTFECRKDLVKWAEGCGMTGKISPFDGNAKMPWKPEWAAKWYTLGITIEGSGKDHSSAGGSHDLAIEIAKNVFEITPPLRFAYEFFLYDGKKMSSSKGLGLTARDLLEVIPPEVVRFLMIKNDPNTAVEFNPFGTQIIPKLYDDYQKAAEEYENSDKTDMARAFELSAVGELTQPPKIRFSTLTQWVQMPNMDEEIKKAGAETWAKYAKAWVEKYAPESERFIVQENTPQQVASLSSKQKEYLKKISGFVSTGNNTEDFQTKIYEAARELGLATKDAFAAIYVALLGKDHGPKAAWLIASLDPEFITKRFSELDSVETQKSEDEKDFKKLDNPKIFSIDKNLSEKYPSISVGVAIIRGVNVQKSDKVLENEKADFVKSIAGLTTEKLGEFPEVKSYRKLYREMGVDWHSKRPSPEALLRRIALSKGLYTVNTCVDAYNLVVMKNRVSIGAFDLDKIEFPTVLRLARENEEILLLGDHEPTKYKLSEIAYFDKTGGFNMDFNYRDAQRTAVQLETKNVFVNVDGVFDITPQQVEISLLEAVEKIMKYCGGTLEEFGVTTS